MKHLGQWQSEGQWEATKFLGIVVAPSGPPLMAPLDATLKNAVSVHVKPGKENWGFETLKEHNNKMLMLRNKNNIL